MEVETRRGRVPCQEKVSYFFRQRREAVEIYRPGREPEVLEGGSAVEGEGPVAGFVLELGKVWGVDWRYESLVS
jgi:hypothetical protein